MGKVLKFKPRSGNVSGPNEDAVVEMQGILRGLFSPDVIAGIRAELEAEAALEDSQLLEDVTIVEEISEN